MINKFLPFTLQQCGGIIEKAVDSQVNRSISEGERVTSDHGGVEKLDFITIG